MGKLTATAVKALIKKPGRHGDGDGLFLEVGRTDQRNAPQRFGSTRISLGRDAAGDLRPVVAALIRASDEHKP